MQVIEETKHNVGLSNKPYKLSIFIFRRDLRLEDNTGLIRALRLSERVLACFIFDAVQIKPENNEYFNSNCVQFMIESLEALNTALTKHNSRLFFFHDDMESAIKTMIKEANPQAIFVNADITPYSRKRDALIQRICKEKSVIFDSSDDAMLFPPGKIMQDNGKFFFVYSHFFNATLKHTVSDPQRNFFINYIPAEIKLSSEYPYSKIHDFYTYNPKLEVRGGRWNATPTVNNMQKFKDYSKFRSLTTYSTTRLSSYIKFGCVSIREVYSNVKPMGKSCKLAKELFWRDFYYNILYFHPSALENNVNYRFKGINYVNDENLFELWKTGKTGCPIIDAGMRHLNATGYMPNRLRMLTANYLIKDFLTDWKKGEKYFAQKLVDYDPANNNGGWQWCAGTGNDASVRMRIFNPILQSHKFDKDCDYIFKWVPELRNCQKQHVHDWETHHHLYKGTVDYPAPMVIHAEQRQKCLKMYGLTPDDVPDEEFFELEERIRNTGQQDVPSTQETRSSSLTPMKTKAKDKENTTQMTLFSFQKRKAPLTPIKDEEIQPRPRVSEPSTQNTMM